jgi:RNA methyltransferase, TrmH family
LITSKNNPRIKNIVKLTKASERQIQNLIVVEGYREIDRAIHSGFQLKQLFVCNELFRNHSWLHQLKKDIIIIEEVSPEVFAKIAYREQSDGLLALFEPKRLSLSDITLKENPLLIVLESVEKPGNLGAVLRTADAAAADAVIICDPKTDIYNPNTIRSSLGCVFAVPTVSCSSQEAISWLQKNKISIIATSLEASVPYTNANLKGSTALVMGTEATGLSGQWTSVADQNIIIPMRGIADSLNISVSTAVVLFEALRQRESV